MMMIAPAYAAGTGPGRRYVEYSRRVNITQYAMPAAHGQSPRGALNCRALPATTASARRSPRGHTGGS